MADTNRARADLPGNKRLWRAVEPRDAAGVSSSGSDIVIHYAVRTCSLGHALIAATDVGICAVLLGNSALDLEDDLKVRFPNAVMTKAGRDFAGLAQRAIDVIETGDTSAPLALNVRGTVFQHKVWQALRDIPAGQTLSYAQLAQRIGQPKAVRAVASACRANPTAVIIPCHRVVGSNGKLTGYRWGLERKRCLLDREKS